MPAPRPTSTSTSTYTNPQWATQMDGLNGTWMMVPTLAGGSSAAAPGIIDQVIDHRWPSAATCRGAELCQSAMVKFQHCSCSEVELSQHPICRVRHSPFLSLNLVSHFILNCSVWYYFVGFFFLVLISKSSKNCTLELVSDHSSDEGSSVYSKTDPTGDWIFVLIDWLCVTV